MSLVVTVYCLFFLLLFCISLFVYIIVRRIIVQKVDGNFLKTYRVIEEDVLDAIDSESQENAIAVAKKFKSHSKALTQVLINYAENVKGMGHAHLKIIFDTVLKKKYLKDLHSRWIVRRLQAIRLFVLFADPTERSLLIDLMKDKPFVRLTVIQALARLPSQKNISTIFDAFVKDQEPQARAYVNIMYGLGDRIESFVGEYMTKLLPAAKLILLIELAGSVPLHSLYDKIIGFSTHPEKEIRIAAARALGNLLLPETKDDLVRLTRDDAWEVQAQAYKGLGKLTLSDSEVILKEGLYSSNWHVRYNAGYSLAKLGDTGIKRLKAIAEEKNDRFASDMATMVLDSIFYT